MKILIADDDNIFRSLVNEILTDAGYTVSPHENGRLAWEHLQAEGADMAVLDINMPVMDGIKTLKEIRKIDVKIPVIMFTAHLEEKVIQGTEDLMVNAFIPKLSEYSDSQSALKTTLDIHRKLKEKDNS